MKKANGIVAASFVLAACLQHGFAAEVVSFKYNNENDVLTDLSFEQRLVRLENIVLGQKSDDLHQELAELSKEVQELRGRLDLQEKKLSTPAVKVVKSENAATSAVSPAVAQLKQGEEELYKKAYAALKDKKYKNAIELLTNYLETYPHGKYVANTYYWLGEVNILEAKYENAVEYYAKVLTNFAEDKKAPNALFKKGMAYLYMKKVPEAMDTFRAVESKYPQTEAANLAKNRIAQLRAVQLEDDGEEE